MSFALAFSKCILCVNSLTCCGVCLIIPALHLFINVNTNKHMHSYPAMGTVKGTIVPEDQRAAIYNVFRLPLNLLVLIYLVGDFSTEASFLANAFLLLVTCVLQIRMIRGGSGIASDNKQHGHES